MRFSFILPVFAAAAIGFAPQSAHAEKGHNSSAHEHPVELAGFWTPGGGRNGNCNTYR